MNEKIILEKFLNFDLNSADQFLQEFATLENAQFSQKLMALTASSMLQVQEKPEFY